MKSESEREQERRGKKPGGYSTLSGKTDKLDEAVNRELNITKS